MNDGQVYDIAIIGGGPIGLACGIQAKLAGLSFIIFEKGVITNSIYHYPRNMTFFSTSERLEIGDIPFISDNPKPHRDEALEYYRRVALKFDLSIHLFEQVNEVSGENNSFKIHTHKSSYNARKIIVATGFYDLPAMLNIPGENLPKVAHYYDDPHFYAMQKVVVVGASNSSVDAALETYRKGADVTMVVRGPEIGKRVKYWVRPDIVNRIEEGSIKAYFNASLTEIKEGEVIIKTETETITIANDFVLALTGYQPDFSLLRKMNIGLSADEKLCPAYNPATMESSKNGIYLAGVICAGMETHRLFIENTRVHAQQIVQHILQKK